MNMARLRKDNPTWEWRAERYGFGWIYKGVREQKTVTVQGFSVACGFSDDNFTTEYYATTEVGSMPYFAWVYRAAK